MLAFWEILEQTEELWAGGHLKQKMRGENKIESEQAIIYFDNDQNTNLWLMVWWMVEFLPLCRTSLQSTRPHICRTAHQPTVALCTDILLK